MYLLHCHGIGRSSTLAEFQVHDKDQQSYFLPR